MGFPGAAAEMQEELRSRAEMRMRWPRSYAPANVSETTPSPNAHDLGPKFLIRSLSPAKPEVGLDVTEFLAVLRTF